MTTQCPKCGIGSCYLWFSSKLDLLQPWLLLFCRLYIGYQSAISGWGHLTHIDNTVDFFKELGVPMPLLNVWISGLTELIGGVLLGLGVFSRVVAIPFTGNFIVAILAPDLHYDKYRMMLTHFWQDQTFIFTDTAFPFLCVGVLVLVFGPGKFSVDHLLFRHLSKSEAKPPEVA